MATPLEPSCRAAFLAGVFAGISACLVSRLALRAFRRKAEAGAETRSKGAGPKDILPDLVQVHKAISGRANCIKRLSDLRDLPRWHVEGGYDRWRERFRGNRQWMINLMPIWNWKAPAPGGAPLAEEFWKLAHAVSRDQNRDDWIAPHVTLHSRSPNFEGLAAKYLQLLNDFGKDAWAELLSTLREQSNWVLDEDTTQRKPSNHEHFVLHKAKVDLPLSFRSWLQENQDEKVLLPRKQDRQANQEAVGKIPITEKFHISLYSFRAARRDTSGSLDPESPSRYQRHVSRSNSYFDEEPRLAHHGIADEVALCSDLARADWMLVLLSPGWTGTPVGIPKVYAAARLSDLACGAMH